MSTNLENFKRNNNKDWNEWVKLVKKAYKVNGYQLTQQQALIIAKESYPGKGNVIGHEEKLEGNIPVKGDEIPENPVRRKKEKAPPNEDLKIQKRRAKTKSSKRNREVLSDSESDSSDDNRKTYRSKRSKRSKDDVETLRRDLKKSSIKEPVEKRSKYKKRKNPEEYYSSSSESESSESEDEYERRRRRSKHKRRK